MDVLWPDMVVVWKNDRNVDEFKLYRHYWLLTSTKRPSKCRTGAHATVVFKLSSLAVLVSSRHLRSLEASKRLSA